ncbi:MAG: translation initiation factor IF-2 [Bacteroidetes bacterium]|nr:translation initiation factor IF-2 [Bacteroidota bacterium]
MADENTVRINKVLRELNISLDRAVEFLNSKGFEVEHRPTAKISTAVYQVLLDEFQTDRQKKEASLEISEEKRREKEALRLQQEKEQEEKRIAQEKHDEVIRAKSSLQGLKTVGKIDLNPKPTPPAETETKTEKPPVEKPTTEQHTEKVESLKVEKIQEVPLEKPLELKKRVVAPEPKEEKNETEKPVSSENKPEKPQTEEKDTEPTIEVTTLQTQYTKLSGPKKTGETIDLSQFNRPKKKKEPEAKPADKNKTNEDKSRKRRRKRISKEGAGAGQKPGDIKKNPKVLKEEPKEEDIQKQVRETLEKLQGKGSKSKAAKYRRDKRETHRSKSEDDLKQQELEDKILKVTEFVTVGEVANMMDVPITEVISACMSLGLMVTMNQRLDAETLSVLADEFGYEVEFVTADLEEPKDEEQDQPEDLVSRAPIVTVMGHVDHGKTSLLDYIRKENVIAGESGGITQHIGAYAVELDGGQKITFLDTPGHEAFTAMRARGAQVTDIAVIVVAADDDVMPQTKEAISHAQAAGVPIVFAINKIDKPDANPEKIKEKLAGMNLLVESWGGKIQSHDISAKTGLGVSELLEKVLLEAEILELKANPKRNAAGTVVEAQLDKGRGYVSTILVQKGTLKIGDYLLAGMHSGKIKAMFDERGNPIKVAGPSTPISVLGLDGAPQAGDKFSVYNDEKEAKQVAAKRTQLYREQSVRTQRHITLDEIGRRIALGQFKELNIIVKGDVDGSVEALTESFQKLSTEEIQIKIIHKGVGPITESDVLLASASDAIIIGFNVRPAGNARTLADKEEIDIRNYSIIYDAINDLKDAMEGMLSPVFKEEITGNAEIRETFKISKIGTIAGCMVTDGKIFRNSKIRIIREGVVVFTGELSSLKRFKDDVKEVSKGYDCGIQIKNYNDIFEGDIIEAYQDVEVKKKLK